MNGYMGDSRELVLCMLMVKLIKMDTNLSREFIGDAYIATNMEMGELIGPSGVRALPLAAGINVGGHYKWHFFSLSFFLSFFLSSGSLLNLT